MYVKKKKKTAVAMLFETKNLFHLQLKYSETDDDSNKTNNNNDENSC